MEWAFSLSLAIHICRLSLFQVTDRVTCETLRLLKEKKSRVCVFLFSIDIQIDRQKKENEDK